MLPSMGRDQNAAWFSAHLKSAFTVVEADAPSLQLDLIDVRELGRQPHAPRPDPFVLTFAGPPNRVLDQRIHRLSHPVLGDLEIFLVPIGPGGDARPQYEAVFN